MKRGRYGGEDGPDAGGSGLGGHGVEVGEGDGGVDALDGVVGAAENDDPLVALVEDVGGEARKHLRGGLGRRCHGRAAAGATIA